MGKRESGLHKSPQRCVSVSQETHQKLKQIAAVRGVTMSALIAEMLDTEERTS
jgi:predicted DNA-binding ribbon-helix-helix protein